MEEGSGDGNARSTGSGGGCSLQEGSGGHPEVYASKAHNAAAPRRRAALDPSLFGKINVNLVQQSK